MEITFEIKTEFKKLIEHAYTASEDAGALVEKALQSAIETPISNDRAEKLLLAVVRQLKAGATKRGDKATLMALNEQIDDIIKQVRDSREKMINNNMKPKSTKKVLKLSSFNGEIPGKVHPRPTFHRKEIPMNCGGVKTTDIVLWHGNERLDIHIGQFRATHGREPTSNEVLDIMLSKMPLPGLSGKDQFKIEELALSIANNGVRKPPIIDTDGTLLDGNRRVAACYYILNSDKFDTEQKKRAENIFVWQLTEHATTDDRDAVVVSLNFEPDNKQDWDEYVKAHIIYNEWQAMLARDPRSPSGPRQTLMKKDLALQFGYREKDYEKVNRYIRMVNWANEFEDYLVAKGEDSFKVKHQANEYFQYFDELSKGTTPGTVAYTLNQDETFKHLVFELLFQGKFVNFKLIRYLKYYNDEVVEELVRARDTPHRETAQDMIERKLEGTNAEQGDTRSGNPNHRIQVFTKWLEQVPIADFRDKITSENLTRLYQALRLVEPHVSETTLESNS